MLNWVKGIADSRLPELPACDDRHFAKCLRIMLAVLPKQNTDELGGELFVEAYSRQLGHYPNEAISFLADRATATCRWFPTIAECLEILRGWHRNDEAQRRKWQAASLVRKEKNQRWVRTEEENRNRHVGISQNEIDGMPPKMIELGIACGALVRDEDGNVTAA